MDAELIVIGATPAALSVAAEARRSGLVSVLVVAVGGPVISDAVEKHRLRVLPARSVEGVERGENGNLVVRLDDGEVEGSLVVVDLTAGGVSPIPWRVPSGITGRIHGRVDFDPDDQDVLVVGGGDAAVAAAWRLIESGARVVVSIKGSAAGLSLVGRQTLEDLERNQQATVLWHSSPDAMEDIGGYPMAVFSDRRTPDLQFDHVVVTESGLPNQDFDIAPAAAEDIILIGPMVEPSTAWAEIRADRFPHLAAVVPRIRRTVDEERARTLSKRHYNATITHFDTAHNELWRLRIRPDHTAVAHRPGQYCSLGLGYWEPRADDCEETGLDARRDKLIRRSYSISSPVFDLYGYLADHVEMDEVELYIVWVRPSGDRVPELTPRLALKHAGDRVYLGPKVAGRYTLAPVVDPAAAVLFCATGTGEAPHNAMVVELLRKGHHGPILSAVSVRYWSDLAYREEHQRLSERFPNYRYLAVPTREPDTPKRYMQDLLVEGDLEDALGCELDPQTSHVFMCGNPSMIGLPDWDDEVPTFPDVVGLARLLHERGFELDRRRIVGNVHYEEYW